MTAVEPGRLWAWRLNVRDRIRTPETNLNLPTCTRVGECDCGAIVAEYDDGTIWNWWAYLGADRTRHDCVGEIVHQLAEYREERAEKEIVHVAPKPAPKPVAKTATQPLARSAIEL